MDFDPCLFEIDSSTSYQFEIYSQPKTLSNPKLRFTKWFSCTKELTNLRKFFPNPQTSSLTTRYIDTTQPQLTNLYIIIKTAWKLDYWRHICTLRNLYKWQNRSHSQMFGYKTAQSLAIYQDPYKIIPMYSATINCVQYANKEKQSP